jgi:hypothetical protein
MARRQCRSWLDNGCSRVRPGYRRTGMSALVLLPGGLPADAELGGNLRPADTLTDRRVDERREIRLGIVSLDPDLLDLLE